MEKVKTIIITALTALTSWLGILAIPTYLLVGLNIADYVTGLCAAKYRGEAISSYKGFRGIAKKIFMWLLVVIGAVLDWVMIYAVNTVGIQLPFTFVVSCLVAVWLICNEIISILENISDIGVDMPPFLMKLVVLIKGKSEEQGNIEPKTEVQK